MRQRRYNEPSTFGWIGKFYAGLFLFCWLLNKL